MSLLNPTATTAVFRLAAHPTLVRQALRAALPAAALGSSRPLSTLRPFACKSPLLLAARTPTHALRQPAHLYSTTSTEGSPAAATTGEAEPKLDWNTFFQLRKTRRRIQVLFSVAGAAGCGTAGSWVLAAGLAEPLIGLIPLDPFFTMGLMAFASATLGWLLGPIVGAAVFNMWHRRVKPLMASKEKEFFARIKKHRVDPRTSSVGNPVPDFYGEKISSVKGYRQWLKDQRAYNRKRMNFI